MKVSVDHTICIGCGQCTKICPDVFDLQNGVSAVILKEISGDLEAKCKEAAERCPVNAISVGE